MDVHDYCTFDGRKIVLNLQTNSGKLHNNLFKKGVVDAKNTPMYVTDESYLVRMLILSSSL